MGSNLGQLHAALLSLHLRRASAQKTFADSARSMLETTFQVVLATVRAKIFATLIVIFFPQLVTKLLLGCVKQAFITASTEAFGT